MVIDNCVMPGDGLMHLDGNLTGPASSLSGILIVNSIITEAMKIASKQGIKLPIYQSQNVDGIDNEHLFIRYEKRIKHV